MHILLLPSWYPDNPQDVSGVFFRDQALALLNHGHKVGVIAPKMRSLRTLLDRRSRSLVPAYELDSGIPTYRKEPFSVLPRVPFGNYWLFRRAARDLFRKYVKRFGKPDIIHAHSLIFGGAAAADLASEYGIPMVLTEHSSGFARNIYTDWQLKLAADGITGASLCIAVSPSLADILGEQFPFSKDRWHWVPNVVADRFKAPKDARQKRGTVRFLNLALMTEKKGQFDLIEAFHRLTQTNQNAELWLAGDGPIRAALEKKVEEFDISDKVRFLGMISPEDVPELLSKIDVMVVSSHYETFGVVAAEALMAGVPVIATKCGGPECIVGKGDGLLVPLRNPKALATAMQELMVHLESFDPHLIAKGARERFSSTAVASLLTHEYGRVVGIDKAQMDRA
jgi:glycosyltransferase involved in cell wall biosynthesis